MESTRAQVAFCPLLPQELKEPGPGGSCAYLDSTNLANLIYERLQQGLECTIACGFGAR